MPSDPGEFKIVEATLGQAILEFFKQNRFTAYSAEEVFFELGLIGVRTTLELIESELLYWMERQRLFSGYRDGAIYYWYDNRLGYRPAR